MQKDSGSPLFMQQKFGTQTPAKMIYESTRGFGTPELFTALVRNLTISLSLKDLDLLFHRLQSPIFSPQTQQPRESVRQPYPTLV